MKCRDCGNMSYFYHRVDAVQLAEYDGDGSFNDAVTEQSETKSVWCAECDSANVRAE
jgi:hypothetical protein